MSSNNSELYNLLQEDINSIRGVTYTHSKLFIAIESFETYLRDLYLFYANSNTTLTAEKEIRKEVKILRKNSKQLNVDHNSPCGVSRNNFIKYLSQCPVLISEKLFESIDINQKGYLGYEEFSDFQKVLKFEEPLYIAKLIFNIFDFNSDQKINIDDIKYLLYYIPGNSSIDTNDKIQNEYFTFKEIDELIGITFPNTQEFDFNHFFDAVLTNNQDFILYIYTYLHECIPSITKNLIYYNIKNYHKNETSFSTSTCSSSATSNKTICNYTEIYKDSLRSSKYIFPSEETIKSFSESIHHTTEKKTSSPNLYLKKISSLNIYNNNVEKKISSQDFNNNKLKIIKNSQKNLFHDINNSEKQLFSGKAESDDKDFIDYVYCETEKRDEGDKLDACDECNNSKDEEDSKLNKLELPKEIINTLQENTMSLNNFYLDDEYNDNETNTNANIINYNADNLTNNTFILYKELNIKDLESELKTCITYKGEVYISTDSQIDEKIVRKSTTNLEITSSYLLLIDNIIYLYDKLESQFKYNKVIFLAGCFLRELPIKIINSKTYYSFVLFLHNEEKQTLLFTDEKVYVTLVTAIRKTAKYQNYFTDYCILSELGEGTYGKVVVSKQSKSSLKHATKILEKVQDKKGYHKRVLTEIDILERCDHPNIIKYYDYYENSEYFFINLEYLKLGNLTTFLKNNKKLKEKTVMNITLQIAQSISYLHKLGIVHRDIKPDNILVDYQQSDINNPIKVIITDFGLAKLLGKDETSKECCGSLLYCAPEVLDRKPYNKCVDIWALGINTYYLITRKYPFKVCKERKDMYKSICADDFSFEGIFNKSPEVNDFIRRCLEKDKSKRITIEEVLNHPWFSI